MIQIITGEDTISTRRQVEVGAGIDCQTILTDSHLKDIFKQCNELVKYYSGSKQIHKVVTFNLNAIQALFYFSKKMNKQEPQIVFYYENGYKEIINDNEIEKVYANLIAPVEKMFAGEL